jgi:hypothetical protein
MRILVIGAMLFLALGLVAQAKSPERPRCENCGMFTDASATTVHAMLKLDGKEGEHNFVCLGCVYEFMHDKYKGKAELAGLKMLDYNTFGTKSPKFIDGKTAWYLVGTSELPGSMEPYIAAFATKEAATKAKADLGGKLMNWKDTWAGITAASDDAKPQSSAGEDEYVCPMCSDVHSDKPGNCPNCGMKLVKKDKEK